MKIEREDRKLGLCGDRFPSLEQRRSLAERMLDARVLRDYREWVRLRREVIAEEIECRRREDERIALHQEILDLHFDRGLGGDEIAAHFGRGSHSWTSERLGEIRRAAMSSAAEKGFVGKICKYPLCDRPVDRINLGRGRKPLYCSRKHAVIDAIRRQRLERRGGKNLAKNITGAP